MGERMTALPGAPRAGEAEQWGMGLAWRAVTALSAGAVAVAVTAGLAAAMPSGSSLLISMVRAVVLVGAAPLMAIGTFRTMRYALVLGGVPAHYSFIPASAPDALSGVCERVMESRRALGATVAIVGLLLGFLGASMSTDDETADEFAEFPRRGFENSASDGGFAVDVGDGASADWWDRGAPGGSDFGSPGGRSGSGDSDSGADRDGGGRDG
ncbi:MAG TPA: hypothetical protein VM618_07085, partial [Acidimicrobiia bacterium]|nr:hypothetical protein [Acidimicrobiia bacterium]